ncbi:MAG: TrkA C-terminal domain-containing protein, partial [Clostridia bacterium]|nr:TrkA C-terminal domain-containing protein [Clostridia bacterium]
KNFRIVTGNEKDEPAPTLREYVHTEDDDIHDLYTYAIEVGKGSGFSNRTIRDTGIREKYDCIILGVQRNGLPLVQPDVDLILGTGDYIWVLGTHQSAQKLLVSEDV